ncbi:hypothetical protein Nepgr_008429 [Nepenthes gracilis]|uniref:Uncharacterized protein n=1 Tax=Nepenthes gracilis TaxID=150966 RepID=A0AAD3S8Z7_NEPGR|nr:hypothetical protein Nepgr_008429 [Nepenthes gracilis]
MPFREGQGHQHPEGSGGHGDSGSSRRLKTDVARKGPQQCQTSHRLSKHRQGRIRRSTRRHIRMPIPKLALR